MQRGRDQGITGHATSRMVAHYTKAADQQKRASAAIIKLREHQMNGAAKHIWEKCQTDGADH